MQVLLLFFFSFLFDLHFISLFEHNSYYICIWKIIHILNDAYLNVFLFLMLILIFNNYGVVFFFSLCILLFYTMSKNNLELSLMVINNCWLDNLALYNGLSVIHPLLVYYFYIYSLSFWAKNSNYICKNNKQGFFIVFIALALGGWWAQQELSWGGWWNWDFVELILFIFLLKNLILIHSKNSNFVWISQFLLFFFYLFIFFFFVRSDVLKSVHSFSTLNFLEKYYIYNYVLINIIIYIYIKINAARSVNFNIIYKFNCTVKFIDYSIYSIYNKFNCTVKFIIYTINTIIWISLWFIIINLFILFFYEFDLIELTFFLKKMLVIITTLLLLLFNNNKKTKFVFLLLLNIMTTFYEFIVLLPITNLIFIKKIKLVITHFVVIISILTVLLYSSFSSYFFGALEHRTNCSLLLDSNLIISNTTKLFKKYSGPLYFLNNFSDFETLSIYKPLDYNSIYIYYLFNVFFLNLNNYTIIFFQYNLYTLFFFLSCATLIRNKKRFTSF